MLTTYESLNDFKSTRFAFEVRRDIYVIDQLEGPYSEKL